MQKYSVLLFFVFFFNLAFSQDKGKSEQRKSLVKTNEQKAKEKAQRAPITSYKIISLDRDTTYVDTTLSIKGYYKYNYLRKDNFGLLAPNNEGQIYTILNFSNNKFDPYPEFGYKAKQMAFLKVDDIKYYSVATPLTDLYFKTTMQQGQSVDALVSVNTSERLNFSVAFRGLRSFGKYINQISSTGSFRFTLSYFTKNKRYAINSHYTGQDFLNGENGGITSPDNFESGDKLYKTRNSIQVFFTDAQTLLKAKRFFVDQAFRINSKDAQNNLYIVNQLNYEHKFFDFTQTNLLSYVAASAGFNRFGAAMVPSAVNDQILYDKIYNKLGAVYENKFLGKFQFFIENFTNTSSQGNPTIIGLQTFPNSFTNKINTIGGQYQYRKNKWNGTISVTNAISKQSMRNADAKITYNFNPKNTFSAQYQNISKVPDNTFNYNRSSYVNYNWDNNFNNEKINNLIFSANTQWLTLNAQLTTLDDYLYFRNIANTTLNPNLQYIAPQQYNHTINYLAITAAKEFHFRKFSLDNTILYQEVTQNNAVLNVPQITTRNTLYFSNYGFKKALYYQTGVSLNYFTKYYANDYNPIIGDYYSQSDTKIGNFPVFDVFASGRIRQARFYLIAEHINALFIKQPTYFTTPTQPYTDFIIRFGLVWNMFQ